MNCARSFLIAGVSILACTTAFAAAWHDIVSPSQGKLPAPQGKVEWRSDLAKSMAEAKSTGRPMFVTFRCLPCKQCSAFDKDVLEGGGDLDPLLKQFITVRLISAKDLDFRIFPAEGFQDMDLSWWGYFLSPEGKVYGIFGGRDEVSDETRISKAALVNTLKRVLAYHYDPRRAEWNIDGPAPDLSAAPRHAMDLPGFASWMKGRTFDKRTQEAGCLHCHQVAEIMRQDPIDKKMFDKVKDTEIWPLPENVGIKVDRDDGLRVTEVVAGSPAQGAGLQEGDWLAMAGGRKLFGQADFRGVLHRGPRGAGSIEIAWLRDGKPMSGKLELESGWRKTDLGWRASLAVGNVGAFAGFYPVQVSAAEKKKLGIPEGTMAVHPLGMSPELKAAGLTQASVVTAIGDDKTDVIGRPWIVHFRMTHEPGEKVTFTFLDEHGATKQVTVVVTERRKGG